MSNRFIGTIQQLTIQSKTETTYFLALSSENLKLPVEEVSEPLEENDTIEVFLYTDKQGNIKPTTHLPTAHLDMYGWGEIVEAIPNLGVFIELGTAVEILISTDDLPLHENVWPAVGDKVYVHLEKDKKNRLLAIPATERIFEDLYKDAETVELNDRLNGHVIRPGREGTVILTEEGYRGFIHHSERQEEPRLGEQVTGRVIEVKEDGSLNLSLLPLKHERMEDDAAMILQYIEKQGGIIPYGNTSDPEAIKEQFGMSKSAFKRALGRLMKAKKIEQKDGKTLLL